MFIEGVWFSITAISLLFVGVIGCCSTPQQQQQQVVVNDDEPKRICPQCGIENPTEASYCGDCGFQFGGNDE